MASPLVGHRYQLLERIGDGAMGSVFQARDHLSGQLVALKQVAVTPQQLQFASRPPAGADDEAALLALAHEFRLLATLRHPHIITVLDYGFTANRQPYFTMELLDQPQTLLEAGRGQPIAGRINLLVQTLQALAYLHRRGILHHDLKPHNVLVSGGQIRVLDFGLAITHDRPRTDDSFGTLLYLPPEVLDGAPFTQAGDLYAVGVMAYELLAGRHPFVADTAGDFIDQVLEAAPDLSGLEAPELAAVVSNLLAKDPAVRYRAAEAVIADVCAAVGQPPPLESASIRESYLQAAAFVGRKAELAVLRSALERALSGQGSAWLVGGESGVGKSRLLEELRTETLVAGALVVRGQGVEGGGLSFQLWREPLRRLVLGVDLSDLAAGVLLEVIPDLETLLGREVPAVPTLEGAAGRQRLIHAITDVLRQHEQPVMLLLEDMQWAAESLEPLREVLRQVDAHPLLIVGTYRDDERPDLPAELPGMQVLKLERLARDAIAALSGSMLGTVGQQPHVVELLARETEGNAFFMVEVVRALAEEAGSLAEIGRATLPARVMAGGVQQIVRRRLGRVPAAARPLLKRAAVAGRLLDLDVLERLRIEDPVLWPEATLADWLQAGADAAVLEVAEERWRFAHDKLRESLLASLTDAERPALHRQVAEAIEAVHGDARGREAYAEVLLEHWHQAGDVMKEAAYLIMVTEHVALFSAEYERARTLAERGLALLAQHTLPEGEHQRMRLLRMLGRADMFLGDQSAAKAHLSASADLARALGDKASQVAALNQLAEATWRGGDYDTAAVYGAESLALAEEIDDPRGAALALNVLGICADTHNEFQAAVNYYQRGLALCQATGNRHTQARLLNNLASTYSNRGDFRAAQDHYQQSLALFQALGERHGIAIALDNLGSLALDRGDHHTAQDYYQRSLAIYQETNDQVGIAGGFESLGAVAMASGDYRLAEGYYRQGLARNQEIGDPRVIANNLNQLGQVLYRLDDHSTAQACMQQSLELYQAVGDRQGIGASLCVLGTLAAARGDDSAARSHLDESLRINRELESRPQVIVSLRALGQMAAERDDGAEDETATGYLEESIALCRATGAQADLARGLCLLAHIQARGGQAQAARAGLAEALHLAQGLKADPLRLEVLLAGARLAHHAHRSAQMVERAALVVAHPHADAPQRRQAGRLLALALPADALAAAIARGPGHDLDQVITELSASLSAGE